MGGRDADAGVAVGDGARPVERGKDGGDGDEGEEENRVGHGCGVINGNVCEFSQRENEGLYLLSCILAFS